MSAERCAVIELRPVWADAPRCCPGLPWPAYRHVPGHTPHPLRHPEGHSAAGQPHAGLSACDTLLFGIDLYHQGYLWEAHEAWEHLWQQAGRNSPEGRLLQALIKTAAATLKAQAGAARGACRHSRDAYALLNVLSAESAPVAGGIASVIDVPFLAAEIARCFGPLWANQRGGTPAGEAYPRIRVIAP